MRWLVLIFFVVAMLLMFGVARAQVCHPLPLMNQALKNHGERPVMTGITIRNHFLMVYVNPKSGSFTIITVRPDQTACLSEVGTSAELYDPVPKTRTRLGERGD